ncbi:MAG TPA: ATP-binding protein [Acidimicrobiales bacterium]|nr:ATP-binding protein [Acidimicrobiales bacterium]
MSPDRRTTRADDQTTEPAAVAEPAPDTFVYPRRARLLAAACIVATGIAVVAFAAATTDDRDGFLLAHGVATAPFLAGTVLIARRVQRECPAPLRLFWRRWALACVPGVLASAAAVAGVLLHSPALLLVDAILLVAGAPLWVSASVLMLQAQAGRRDASVDVIDSTMALVVLSAPGVLLAAEPLIAASEKAFAVPFALFIAFIPAGLYTSLVNLARVPRAERITQGLGVVLAGAFGVNASLQVAHVVGHLELPLPVFVGVHTLTMALVMALPLWAHRVVSGGLARLPVERQVRRSNPMPTISAVVLPLLVAYVLVWHGEAWSVVYLTVVLLAVVVLNAVRHALLSREAQRLSGELAGMAEERRRLLASMVRALDDDRRRTVSELHSQAIGSLSSLGTIVQTAYVSLPPATAAAVRETLAQLQGDLTDRAEELRRLLVAMRPPALAAGGCPDSREPRPDSDDVLSTALRAYAAELDGGATAAERPLVRVTVDPALELDRPTMTIVYRIAQEALLNAARHAHATTVDVAIGAVDDPAGVVIEVADDGVGFDARRVRGGSGLASMQLFTTLGHGEMTVESRPGDGTVVRSRLGVHAGAGNGAAAGRAAASGTGPTADAVAGRRGDGRRPAAGAGEDGAGTEPGIRSGRSHLRLLPAVEPTPAP